ncbi:mannosyl-oligosaccharide glucosidase-like [Mytilus californianus]|uniref:mannosyl-oligosaccharide glucosidase-like n=1 Tax=Mytilus californianus TaxID=6549 RepID=UPI002245628D|nr:mannosyl-oligosaccharide glucosidase-like [Mytilus californianus]
MAEAGQTQFLRCKLVVFDVLTNIMRKYMAPEGIAPKAIYNSIIQSKAFKRILTTQEFERIQNLETAGFENFDINLMYKIAKFPMFSMIIPDVPTRKWGSEPSSNENSIGDNIMRIVNRRNELVHKHNTTFLDSEFEDLFDKYLDIGRRAEKHLSLSEESLRSQIRKYKTCCIDKNMEEKIDKLSRENEDLKRILFKYQSKDGVNLEMYASIGTQTMIDCFQATPSSEGTSSAELRILGIENSAERANLIYSRRDDINTDNISINNATDGSLLLFLTIRNSIFISDELIEIEIKKFIDNVFDIADLRCSKIGQCNLILHIENNSDCSDMEELESDNDLVLHLDIKNSAFKTDYSISQTFNQFISNVLTSMNGQPLTNRREVTAILDVKENELAVVSPFGQAQKAIEHDKGKDEYSSEKKGDKTTTIKNNGDKDSRCHKDNRLKYRIPLLMIFAVIIVIVAVFGNIVYNRIMETRIVTPLDIPKINSENVTGADINSELFWGTYRSNLYFGMKTRSPKSPVIGLMWFEQSLSENAWQQHVPKIRHWCDQRHNISKYGWLRHDGKNFGIQEIVENTFIFNTSFVKRAGGSHGGDWSARITAMPKDIKKKVIVSFLVYFAFEGGDGNMVPVMNSEDSIDYINGSTSDLGYFQLKFPPTILSKKVKFSHKMIHYSNLTQLELLVKAYMTINFWNTTHYFNSLDGEGGNSGNVLVYQVTAEVPVQFDIVFESLSFHKRQECLKDSVFTREFNGYSQSFDDRFSSIFKLKTRGYDTKSIDFAKAALSNLLGEISYFYGSSLVKSKYNQIPIDYWYSPLYTSIPSRSLFPRGFLWNVGFDNILISLWNSTISEEIIAHWLDLVNIEGWIPREQILGDEARAKTPEKFIVQENDNANPPTLFLTIQNLVSRNLTNTDFLRRIFPRLKMWLNWINVSQVGNNPHTYYWRDRNRDTMKFNPLTSSSGFDDYPRASHPTTDERHVDLRCWIAMAYGVLSDIAKIIQEEWQDYEATYKLLMNNDILDNLHWSPERQIYSDYGFHTDDVTLHNQTVNATTKPKLRFINSFGYVSLFPLMLKIINPESPRLHKILTNLIDRKLLWTDYGLRSLETTSPFYQKWNTIDDPPYWRGAIWINMNYLTLSGLHYYSNTPGKYKNLAATIYKDLRNNIVTNVINEYYKKGYIYEQYNDNTGEGKGCHPFSGWSALIVAIMAEKYN